MRILAIETATPASSVALGENDVLVAMNVLVDRRGHTGFLMPAIDFCFERAGWKRSDVDVVAVDVGPGPFTGLRSGIATAQAFAAAVGAPIVGVSSLTAIAMRAATGHRRIWPVVDMRRGEVAAAPYRPLPGGVAPDGDPEVVSPTDLHGLLESDGSEALVVGDWQSLPDSTWSGLHRVRLGRPRFPSADVVLEIGVLLASRGDYWSAEEVRPNYMRDPDARITWREFRSDGLWEDGDARDT